MSHHRRPCYLLPLLMVATLGGCGHAPAPAAPVVVVPAPPRSAWRTLFNGRDLSGWSTYLAAPARGQPPLGQDSDPRGVFTVVTVDGAPAIRISGEIYGALTSEEELGDFHLRADFRWGEARWAPRARSPRDSGILYRARGPQGAAFGAWMEAFELQIQESECGDGYALGNVLGDIAGYVAPSPPGHNFPQAAYYSVGHPAVAVGQGLPAGYRVVKAANGEAAHGQWNRVEIICRGDVAVHVVNGVETMRITGLRTRTGDGDVPLLRGRLQLQSEGAEVFFRNLEISDPIGAVGSR